MQGSSFRTDLKFMTKIILKIGPRCSRCIFENRLSLKKFLCLIGIQKLFLSGFWIFFEASKRDKVNLGNPLGVKFEGDCLFRMDPADSRTTKDPKIK